MAMVVRAFPVLPGKEPAARDFAHTLNSARRDDVGAFFSRYGVTRESWHLQQTAQGALIIVVTELGASPGLQVHVQAQAYASAQHSFDRWFKDSVRDLCGINPDEQPLGPPTETIFDWNDRPEPRPSS
jgi:hypothetical protein